MKAAKKFIEKQEKEKKKVKTVAYYKNFLKTLDIETVEKMRKVAKIIKEEIELIDTHGYEPPYMIVIDKDKFSKAGLLLSDAEKIINLFTTFKYLALPKIPPSSEEGGFLTEFTVNLPIQGWDTALQDWNLKYPHQKNFQNLYKALTNIKQIQEIGLKKPIKEKGVVDLPKTFEIQVKDRYIWINNYLLSKPHAVGSNFEFFEYIRSKPPNTLIARDKMPNVGDRIGYGYTKEVIKKKGFIKILNELGFKGEILKAFFYKRSKDTLIYRGDKIKKEDLNKAGIKFSLFIKELELAHTKNSPE